MIQPSSPASKDPATSSKNYANTKNVTGPTPNYKMPQQTKSGNSLTGRKASETTLPPPSHVDQINPRQPHPRTKGMPYGTNSFNPHLTWKESPNQTSTPTSQATSPSRKPLKRKSVMPSLTPAIIQPLAPHKSHTNPSSGPGPLTKANSSFSP